MSPVRARAGALLGSLHARAVVLVAVAAVLPLASLGAVAVERARRTLLDEAERANRDLALRAAADLSAQVARFDEILRSLALALSPSTRLSPAQAGALLRNQRIEAREFLALDHVTPDGREAATGRVDEDRRERGGEPAVRAALGGAAFRSPVRVSSEAVPVMTLAVPQRAGGRVVGALVATVDITEMWSRIDRLRVGARGYARVVGEDGTLIAVGAPEQKRAVFTGEKVAADAPAGGVVRAALAGQTAAARYVGAGGEEVLGVGVPVGALGWGLVLEQPVEEAIAPYRPFRNLVVVLSAVLLALAAAAGYRGARSVVVPIERLRLRAVEIAGGLLDARVEIDGPEELAALAEAMNRMSADLIRLQDEVRRQERVAMLGRLAAGFAHDLKHPVRAIQSEARRALERVGDDPGGRQALAAVVSRELRRIDDLLDDLRRVARGNPSAVPRDRLDVGELVRGFTAELRAGRGPALVQILDENGAGGEPGPLPILGGRELLRRVLENLAENAFDAMEGDGTLRFRLARIVDGAGARAELRVCDSGPGVPADRLAGIFSDLVTTRPRGLGLGLAVCRRIVEDHRGTIRCERARADEGGGAAFVVELPLVPPDPAP